MVIKFANLPPHLQKDIAVKMNITDSFQFQQSSRQGRKMGALVQKELTMDVQKIEVQMTDVVVVKDYDDFFEDEKDKLSWNQIRNYENCPRFQGDTIFNLSASNERWLEILREVEFGHFSGKESNFHSLVPRLSLDPLVFERIFEAFNVTSFSCTGEIDLQLVRLPVFRRLNTVRIYDAMLEVEDLLALEAVTIEARVKPEDFSSALNQVFKQFHTNQRTITNFKLASHDPVLTRHVRPEEMFDGIPSWSILWSHATHANTLLARVPIEEVELGSMNSYCSIRNDSNVLFVTIEPNRVKAKVVRNAVTEFEEMISDKMYYLATGFCRGCETFKCRC